MGGWYYFFVDLFGMVEFWVIERMFKYVWLIYKFRSFSGDFRVFILFLRFVLENGGEDFGVVGKVFEI